MSCGKYDGADVNGRKKIKLIVSAFFFLTEKITSHSLFLL